MSVLRRPTKNLVAAVAGVAANKINDLSATPGAVEGVAGCCGAPQHISGAVECVAAEVLQENTCNNNELDSSATQATQATPILEETLATTTAQFLGAIQTVRLDARILTDAEKAEGSEFREQLILLRADNARVYANPTPWKRKR